MRQSFLNPEKVLRQLRLKEDIVVADFGCGSGGWVIPLAREVEERKIYAIDILEEPLSALKARAKLEKISTIETIQADVETEKGSRLPDSCCDLVLMTNLLFQCEDKSAILKEGKRVLKPRGKILIVDWKKDAPLGPKEGRISLEEIKRLAREINLKVAKELEAGIYHWALTVVK